MVRPDLPLGLLAAQVTHAAGESSPGSLPPNTNAVVLAATESELLDLAGRLTALGVPHAAIRECDPPFSGQITAIGIRPGLRSAFRRLVSSFPLLREKGGKPAEQG